MQSLAAVVLSVIWVLPALGTAQDQWDDVIARGPDVAGGYASTHLLICVQPGVTAAIDAAGRPVLTRNVGVEQPVLRGQERRVAKTLRRFGANRIEGALPSAPVHRIAQAQQFGLDRILRVRVDPGTDLPAMVESLESFPDLIDYVELDALGSLAQTIPDDSSFGLQYALLNTGQLIAGQPGDAGADISTTYAWDETTGSSSVRLALLDAGLDEHFELNGRLVPGWNTVSNNDDTSDACASHGTTVAGVAGANSDGVGIVGVDWACQIMPVRVFNSCVGSESAMAAGITWATDNGADVINVSAQYPTGTTTLRNAVLAAYDAGVVIVAAAGNAGFSGGVAFPARWDETIAVAATDNRDERWFDSNTGPEVTVSAPGVDVFTLLGTEFYDFRSGTSYATPHVAGLVCLMLSLDDTLTPDEVRDILICTADDVDATGFDEQTGYGRINADRAARATIEGLRNAGDVDGDGVVNTRDLLIVLGGWGPCPDEPDPCHGDVVFDGVVNTLDLLHVLEHWD